MKHGFCSIQRIPSKTLHLKSLCAGWGSKGVWGLLPCATIHKSVALGPKFEKSVKRGSMVAENASRWWRCNWVVLLAKQVPRVTENLIAKPNGRPESEHRKDGVWKAVKYTFKRQCYVGPVVSMNSLGLRGVVFARLAEHTSQHVD